MRDTAENTINNILYITRSILHVSLHGGRGAAIYFRGGRYHLQTRNIYYVTGTIHFCDSTMSTPVGIIYHT